jgi:hypothetical protein
MGGENERTALNAVEELWAKLIADAPVAQLQEEAAAHGVDLLTWLARTGATQEWPPSLHTSDLSRPWAWGRSASPATRPCHGRARSH